MRRSLRKMLRPGEKKEPRDFVCLGVEDHKDNSNDFKVVFEGNKCGLQNFVKKQKRFKKYDDVNASPLHHAAEEGQVELMEMIVNESSCEVLNVMDDYGNTPLHWAAGKNQVESVKFLLRKGANPNLRNCSMMAPLHVAVQGGYNDVMKFIQNGRLASSIQPNHQNAHLLLAEEAGEEGGDGEGHGGSDTWNGQEQKGFGASPDLLLLRSQKTQREKSC